MFTTIITVTEALSRLGLSSSVDNFIILLEEKGVKTFTQDGQLMVDIDEFYIIS